MWRLVSEDIFCVWKSISSKWYSQRANVINWKNENLEVTRTFFFFLYYKRIWKVLFWNQHQLLCHILLKLIHGLKSPGKINNSHRAKPGVRGLYQTYGYTTFCKKKIPAEDIIVNAIVAEYTSSFNDISLLKSVLWLSSYIKIIQPVPERFKIASYFIL